MADDRQIAAGDRSPVGRAVSVQHDGVGERAEIDAQHQGEHRQELRQHDPDLTDRCGEQQLERVVAPLLGEGAHGERRRQEDREDVHLVEDVDEVGDLGGEQRQAEGVAQHQQEDGGHGVGDRRAEGRQQLLAQQYAERPHDRMLMPATETRLRGRACRPWRARRAGGRRAARRRGRPSLPPRPAHGCSSARYDGRRGRGSDPALR